MRISRYHFELRMQNDRLYLHTLSPGGTEHQGEVLGGGALRVVHDGDLISPLPGRSHTMAVRVRFAAEQGAVDRVRLQRQPALP